MEILTKTPHQLGPGDAVDIAKLAGIGFGQGDTLEMYEDSLAHIYGCDSLQLCYDESGIIAFSMAKECLWRPCH